MHLPGNFKIRYVIPALILVLVLMTPGVTHAGFIYDALWGLTASFFGLFAGLAGSLLDYGISQYVIGFGKNYFDSGVGATVDMLWKSVRDIFNLTFIFGLVYIGFKMILNSDDSNTKRWLVHLILAAILVNFSLLITKLVVDVSNTLATQVAMNGFNDASSADFSISGVFMDALGVSNIWNLDVNSMPSDMGIKGASAFGYILGTAVILIILTFVFAAGGILLFIRYVALTLYMVLSPLMFLGWVFPQLQSISDKYWRGFLGRAFFAPIYLLLVYFAAVVIRQFQATNTIKGDAVDYSKVFTGGGDAVGTSFGATIPPFALTAIFLIAAVVVANKLGADGASSAMKVGRNLRGVVQRGVGGMTAGAGARVMRNTAGRGARAIAESDKMKGFASRNVLARQVFKSAQKVQTNSFDVRQVGGLGSTLGVGTGVKGGFKKSVEDRKKADVKLAESLHVKRDKNSVEYQTEMLEKSEAIKKGADTELALLDHSQSVLDEVQGKTEEELKTKLETANEELKTAKTELAEAKADNTKTQPEIEALELATAKAADTVSITDNGLTAQRQKDEINASDKSAAQKAQEIASIDHKRTAFENVLKIKKEEVGKLAGDEGDAVKNRQIRADSELEFANELAFIKQLESSARFWDSRGVQSTSSTLGAGVAAGVAGVGMGAGVGLVAGHATTGAYAARTRASAVNLREKYGDDGSAMAKTKEQQKFFEGLAAAQKKEAGEPNQDNSPSPNPPATPPAEDPSVT